MKRVETEVVNHGLEFNSIVLLGKAVEIGLSHLKNMAGLADADSGRRYRTALPCRRLLGFTGLL
ncbi:MAG: hypothetical protein PHH11_01075 [Methylomonas sp.]|nr:hypothetical protein [Methylomonas sp.]